MELLIPSSGEQLGGLVSGYPAVALNAGKTLASCNPLYYSPPITKSSVRSYVSIGIKAYLVPAYPGSVWSWLFLGWEVLIPHRPPPLPEHRFFGYSLMVPSQDFHADPGLGLGSFGCSSMFFCAASFQNSLGSRRGNLPTVPAYGKENF